MSTNVRAILGGIGVVVGILALCTLVVLAFGKSERAFRASHNEVCSRSETFVSYQPVANRNGYITQYSYQTADGKIYNDFEKYPINQAVCIETVWVEK